MSAREVAIGDVCELINGRAFKPSDWTSDGLPIVRIQNLNDESAPFNRYDGPVRDRFLIDDGALLFSWSGTPGTSFGAFFWNRGRAILNQHIFHVLPREGVEKKYLRYALNGRIGRIIAQAHGGVGLQHITKDKLEATTIPLPAIAEQRRIADMLDKADAIRRKRKEAIALTEELLRATFLEMFGDPVTNPKGWAVKALLELCSPKQWPTIAASELSGSGYPVFGANGVIGHHSEMNHAVATVLITCRGATCGTINVCSPNSYVTGNSMALDDPDPTVITREYLEWALRLRGLNDTITGSAQPQITRQSLQKVAFGVPPVPTQQAFERVVQRNARLRDGLLRATSRANDVFDTLVARAFSSSPESVR